MQQDAKEEIKQRLNIVDVIGRYIRLQKGGRELKGLCPFHDEKSPSFTVSPDRQVWYCFGCSEGGDMFSFIERIEHTDFRGALEILASQAGVTIEEHPAATQQSQERKRLQELHAAAQQYYAHVLWKTPVGEPGRDILVERSVEPGVAELFGIGFAPGGGDDGDALIRYLVAKAGASEEELIQGGLAQQSSGRKPRDKFRNRLMFPIRDERGRVIAFGGRALGDAIPKYLNSPETLLYHKSATLFGLDMAREAVRMLNAVVLVEGYFDVVALHRAGVTNVVASSGTALTEQHVRILRRYTDRIILCFDHDAAGQQAARRAALLCAAQEVRARIVELPRGVKDPDELVRQNPEGLRGAVEHARPEWEVLLDWAVGAGGETDVEARRESLERALQLLHSIPEASVRELYAQQLASRLHLHPDAVQADLARLARKELPLRKADQQSQGAPRSSVESRGNPPHRAQQQIEQMGSPTDAYLGALLAQEPRMTADLLAAEGLEPGEIRYPVVARMYEIARTVATGEQFPLDALPEEDRPHVARFALRDLPGVHGSDPATQRKIVLDCIASLRRTRFQYETARIRAALRDATKSGDSGEAEVLSRELQELLAVWKSQGRTSPEGKSEKV